MKTNVWYEGQDLHTCDFPAPPHLGDIVQFEGEFYTVASLQWDIDGKNVVLNIHIEDMPPY